jgi:ATP/maltotriose-dependent transcriptional regulator MalT
LVGRDQETQLLVQLLDETHTGSSRFAFLSGEPGIGKTCLLLALRSEAEQRGCLTLHGSAAEFERELPFGLIVAALDEYLESLDPRVFSRLATEDVAELAGVFPALRSLAPGLGEPSTAAERFRAHRAVRKLTERLAVRQPLVLLLDDLHWADAATLELISYLFRHPPHAAVMVAVTFRSGQLDDGLTAVIERALDEAERSSHVELGPLGPAEAQALIDVTDPAEYERLYAASGGNPFYMMQLARPASTTGSGLDAHGESSDVPVAVSAAIRAELRALSPPARGLAQAASVVGDPFELDLTLAATGASETDTLAALDELIAKDLVRSTQVPRRFHFRHPLVRRAVYESSPPGARITSHRRTAQALFKRGAPAAVRAHHVEHSAQHGDTAAVQVLCDAGEAAAQRAPVSAARYFGAALGLLPTSSPRRERVGILTALARAEAATGRFEESRAALLECIDLTAEDDPDRHLNLIASCASVEQLLGHHEEAHARLTRAISGLADTSSGAAVKLIINLAVGDFYRMDYEGMAKWGHRALTAARPLRKPPLAAASNAVLAVANAFSGAISEAEARCTEAAALLTAISDQDLAPRLDTLAHLATAELYLHRYAEAGAHAKRGLAIARATGQGDISPVLIPVLSHVLHVSGRIAESAELLDGAVDAARLSGNVEALGWNLLSRAFTAIAAGDLELAIRAASESVKITRDLDDGLVSTYAGLALATALLESGEPGRAIDVLVVAAGGDQLPHITCGWRPNYFELLTRCWLELGEPAEAQRTARRASESAADVGLPLATALASRAVAAVTLASGDPATAALQALAGADVATDVGAHVEAARARVLAGQAMARAGQRDEAVAELGRAIRQLDSYGAVRYRQGAEHELRKLGQPVHRRTRPGNPHARGIQSLTQREKEIAWLVVDRRTNPQIAHELFLSIKTIETHMRNIFRKLGVSSRVDVARVVERAERDP